MPTIYNASNELAVSIFLEGKIQYLQIVELIEKAMNTHKIIENPTLEQILEAEKEAHESVREALKLVTV